MTPPLSNNAGTPHPIDQALHEVDAALAQYNADGAAANQVAAQESDKAKTGDADAQAKIDAAEKKRLDSQQKLKIAQSRLARLTGTDDPHRRRVTVADRRPTGVQKLELKPLTIKIEDKATPRVGAYMEVIQSRSERVIDLISPKEMDELLKSFTVDKRQSPPKKVGMEMLRAPGTPIPQAKPTKTQPKS